MSNLDNPSYNCWKKMRNRCNNPANTNYPYYGGRGISVCAKWASFDAFAADMGPRPSPDHTIDRIDPNKNYTPENCRWATRAEQARNKTNHVTVEVDGKSILAVELAESVGADPSTIYKRIRRGWSAQDIQRIPTYSRRDTRQLEDDIGKYLDELKKKKEKSPTSGYLLGTNSNADK